MGPFDTDPVWIVSSLGYFLRVRRARVLSSVETELSRRGLQEVNTNAGNSNRLSFLVWQVLPAAACGGLLKMEGLRTPQ